MVMLRNSALFEVRHSATTKPAKVPPMKASSETSRVQRTASIRMPRWLHENSVII